MRAATEVRRTGRRGHALRHPVRFALAGAVLVLFARSALADVPATTPGAPVCKVLPGATAVQYETGAACPPAGFAEAAGYEPELAQTPAGWRYTRPAGADGGCSGPLPDGGPFWDFGAACRAHDYGYDLIRFGVGDRTASDDLLYRDMKRTCLATGILGAPMCKTLADSTHAVLWVGDVSPGFEPAPDELT
jgi:hypothetical protein